MWPISAAQPARAAVDLAVQQQAAADPGAERDHHRVPGARGRAGARLGEHRRVARRCPPPPAARAARSSGRGSGTPSSGRWFDQRDTPVSRSTSAGMPKPIASTSGAAARTSSTASMKMSSVSCRSAPRQVRCTLWWTTSSSSTTPPRSFVPPASMPITRLGGMAGRYTEGGERPDSRPPGVQGLPLARKRRWRAAATSMRSEAALAPPRPATSRARPRERARRSPPGACSSGSRSRSAAGCCSRSSCS